MLNALVAGRARTAGDGAWPPHMPAGLRVMARVRP
jgi:hypothetical protein